MYVSPADLTEVSAIALDELDRILSAYRAKHTTQNRKPTTKPKRTKRFKHVYCAAHKLSRKVGIEFSWIGGILFDGEGISVNGLYQAANNYASAMFPFVERDVQKAKVKVKKITMDPGCIEIPSAKIGTRRVLRRTAKTLHEIAAQYNLVGHTAYHGGGGAHVHVNTLRPGEKLSPEWSTENKGDPMDKPEVQYLLLDMTHRPYINWAFTNPGDVENTGHTCGMELAAYRDANYSKPVITRESLTRTIELAVTNLARARANAVEWAERYRNNQNESHPSWSYSRRRAHVGACMNSDEAARVRRCMLELGRARKALAKWEAEQANKPAEVAPSVRTPREAVLKYMRGNMGKAYGVVPRKAYGTLEFRLFQAPNRWQEHEKHVDFALAYVEWCEQQAKTGKMPNAYEYPMRADRHNSPDHAAFVAQWPLDRCKKEFVKFCTMIGLDSAAYKPYLKRMEARFKLAETKPALMHSQC